MANYHLSIKIISRGNGGKSAVAAAAYRAGEKIIDKRLGIVYDYTRKGGVVHTEILLPGQAPQEYKDRAVLWNAVEKIERNGNAQLAREIELSLPVELTMEQNISIACEYIKRHFVEKGMCADLCIHDTGKGNPHAHVMLTMRPIEQDGTWGAKSKKEYILDGSGERIKLKSGEYKSRKIDAVDWNDRGKAEEWRAAWSSAVNAFFERQGTKIRIDHRSYARQGTDQIPTVHLGVAAHQMEKRGIRTGRGDMNRAIGIANQEMRRINARIRKAKEWLYAQPVENTPTFLSIMQNIADVKNLNTQYQRTANLKTQAKVLSFLLSNDISNTEQLVAKVTKMSEDYLEVSGEIKKTERRFGVLAKHLAQYEIFRKHKAVYEKYRQLDPKKRGAFYEKHENEIVSYRDARDYIKAALNGKTTTIPVREWEAEQKKLLAHRFAFCDKFYGLKEDLRCVELLKKGVVNLMREDGREQAATRNRRVAR